MNNLSSPLNLKNALPKHKVTFPAIPFIDILAISLFVSLLSTHFLFAPGLTINLPASAHSQLPGSTSTAVISVNHTNMIFFEGQIVSPQQLLPTLQQHIKNKNNPSNHTLLAKISKNANINTFFNICEVAQLAGFAHVQLASNSLTIKP